MSELAGLFEEMLREDLPSRLSALRRGLSELALGRPEALCHEAHKLSGAGGTVGRPDLSRLGRLWEAALSGFVNADEAGRRERLSASEEALRYVEAVLEGLYQRGSGPTEEHPAFARLSACAR